MLKKVLIGALILVMVSLSACMSLGNVSYKQARMLKQEGFILSDDGWTLALPERLLFGFDEYAIQNSQKERLNQLAQQLHKYDLDKLKFIGHTDNVGLASYNQTLSEKRAQNVAQIFLDQGFERKNIQVIGRGATQPMVSNDTPANRATNRRVNVTIVP